MLANQGQVSLEGPADSHLIVELGSDDTSEIIVPAAVLIFAGEDSATFDLIIIKDDVSDGAEIVNISASAENYISCSESIQVMDADAAKIPGDVDYSGDVELRDAIGVLKLMAGIKVRHVYREADMNGDGKMGPEEVISILKQLAER